MFTGIIETMGLVREVQTAGSNRSFWVESSFWDQLKPDQSLSHDGVCLTVESCKEGCHRVTAIAETLKRSNLGHWREGTLVNLERCLAVNGRLDGHFVQGHVDTTGICEKARQRDGSWEFDIAFPASFGNLIVEKGSITLNGISLTAFKVRRKKFRVAIIPYTFEHTSICKLREGDTVNLEFDLLGKYILRNASLHT